jgi:membrane protein YqaA with SNARE-associated domain
LEDLLSLGQIRAERETPMNFENMLTHYGLYLSTYIIAVISGFVPFVNIEVYLVWVAALTPRAQGLPITILATLGQMTAKTLMYLGGAGIIKTTLRKPEEKMAAVRKKFERWKNQTSLFIFLSAFLGVPPFYIVSVVSGALKIKLPRFLITGLVGRFLRFALFVFFPHLIKGIFH